MTVETLIKKDSTEVRGSTSLMSFYIIAFEKEFGFKPNCAGCTFARDFIKLKNRINNKNKKDDTMKKALNEITFKLKKVTGKKILTYKIDGKPVRRYDDRMTEEFAIGFLTNGTKEEIKEREAMFEILPEGYKKKAPAAQAKTAASNTKAIKVDAEEVAPVATEGVKAAAEETAEPVKKKDEPATEEKTEKSNSDTGDASPEE